jgi:NADPH-dependent 2,4-dienoyl-CoA reductase/sulfur reductase-like enzyme
LDGVFSLKQIPDADRIRAYIEKAKPRNAVVVGGGFIGLEMTETLLLRLSGYHR